jgi:hypothetical protein
LRTETDLFNFEVLEQYEQEFLNLTKGQYNIYDYIKYIKNTNRGINVYYKINESLIIKCYESKIKIEFNETKPLHLRMLLNDQINLIFNKIPYLNGIKFEDIHTSSWWSLLWSPNKSSVPQFMNTSFLVFYHLKINKSNNKEVLSTSSGIIVEVPIVGILPLKLRDQTWLSTIKPIIESNNDNTNNIYSQMNFDWSYVKDNSIVT